MADYSNVLPSTAVVAGIGGVGGFLYDRYIRGNKKLEDNLKAVLVGGGIGGLVGAATSVGSAYLNGKKGVLDSAREATTDPETFRRENVLPLLGAGVGGVAAYRAYGKPTQQQAFEQAVAKKQQEYGAISPQQVKALLKAQKLELRRNKAAEQQVRLDNPDFREYKLPKPKTSKGDTKAPTGLWTNAKHALNPFKAPLRSGRAARVGKSLYTAALTAAATEVARQAFLVER